MILDAARASQQSERDVTIVAVALACWLRKDELRNFRWPVDVDLKREVLWIRDAKAAAGVRCVPISPRVVTLIDLYVKDWRPSRATGPLFLNRHGDPFSYDGFGQIFRRLQRRLSGVARRQDPPRPQHGAHELASCWRRHRHDRRARGHTDIAHTEHYLGDITPEEIARIPDAFGRLYGRKVLAGSTRSARRITRSLRARLTREHEKAEHFVGPVAQR